VLVAVERVGADITALGRALATQPEEVAARIDVDAAAASIGVRVSSLGSALDQFRLSLLAAVARLEPRLDAVGASVAASDPRDRLTSLEEVVAELADRARSGGGGAESAEVIAAVDRLGERLASIEEATGRAVDDLRLGAAAVAAAAADPGDRLAKLEEAVTDLGDGIRAGAAIADALDNLAVRMASIEQAAGEIADDDRVFVERMAAVPDRLTAIAAQVDRITPLARAGDESGSLFDQLDRLSAGLNDVMTLLQGSGRRAGDAAAETDDDRFDAVVDVLAGVTRRQDAVTAAVASVLDLARGPRSADAVLERMEQRERSLAARLDRIDAELRRQIDTRAGASPGADAGIAAGLRSLNALVEQRERVLAGRLDQLDAEMRRVREATAAAAALPVGSDHALDTVLERLTTQEETVGRHLGWVGDRLAEVAAHLMPDAGAAEAAADAARRDEERFTTMGTTLAGVARRQDELADAIAALVAAGTQVNPPDSAMTLLAAPIERIARATDDLAGLVVETAERLDRRISEVEAAVVRAGTSPPTSQQQTDPQAAEAKALAEDAARRLAELRAERALVQARLQEERLLAAEAWDDEP